VVVLAVTVSAASVVDGVSQAWRVLVEVVALR
jgi:hypothetical protein